MFKKFFVLSFFSISFLSFFISFTTSTSKINFIFPTKTKNISSYYGYREIFGSISFHNGIDFPLPHMTDVYASMDGTISCVRFLNGYGNTVIISHENGYKTLYSHLDSNFFVKEGQIVHQGQLIAKIGPKYLENGKLNGYTTGPHLHFSIFSSDGNTLDPLSLLTD